MARRPRVLLPDIPLHIIQRGNNRSACFYSDEDYIFYIDTLAMLAEFYGCKVHVNQLPTLILLYAMLCKRRWIQEKPRSKV